MAEIPEIDIPDEPIVAYATVEDLARDVVVPGLSHNIHLRGGVFSVAAALAIADRLCALAKAIQAGDKRAIEILTA